MTNEERLLYLEKVLKERMSFNVYQQLQKRTMKDKTSLIEMCFGIIGESGELIDHIKKYLFHEHKLDNDYIQKEIGDVLWYLSGVCSLLGINLEEVAKGNIEKLRKRYPNGFESERSINRGD